MRLFFALLSISLSGILAVPVSERISSYPFVSGDTFRAFADHILDETGITFCLDNIQKGDIIFVKTDFLSFFFSEIHPRIKYPYILITHNSDYTVPQHFAHYLDDPKLFAWFGQNIDRQHPKLFPIPIGLANHYWPHGKFQFIKELQKQLENKSKTIFLYINYDTSTSNQRKNAALEILAKSSFAYNPERKPFQEYLQDLAHSFFVVSPPGNGPDCHRTWESLYVGAIPIVKRSALSKLYQELPILQVDEWTEISEQMLTIKLAEFENKNFNFNKLYADYWFDLIRSTKQACIESK